MATLTTACENHAYTHSMDYFCGKYSTIPLPPPYAKNSNSPKKRKNTIILQVLAEGV